MRLNTSTPLLLIVGISLSLPYVCLAQKNQTEYKISTISIHEDSNKAEEEFVIALDDIELRELIPDNYGSVRVSEKRIALLRPTTKQKFKRISEFRIIELDNGNTLHEAKYRAKNMQIDINAYYDPDHQLLFMIIKEPNRFTLMKLQEIPERLPETR